ncbi:alpha/beta fold hydrolase [Streptomyces sp. VRA16 Mangrove soil]|uniref:alpha/beta fold hydrolase n=1 Tax=Streptomyces sp. VRA16 Mangrove soil TaxID=2817434 RepID=UPI001A9F5B94|nr:alpha/beta hydrolase [Streptomyces sp. VRA16 Mangrove soil]MBO1337272.1 alpha/beta hydrolase [Streptomyces sp. VRA16 Mangrove soil]
MTTWRTEGKGNGLVLVHGAGPGSVTWQDMVSRFTDRYTVILPDLSGSDPVADTGEPLTVAGLTDELATVVEEFGGGPVDVVGHSLGAVVTLSLAATRPDLVRRAVPVAGCGHTEDAYVQNAMRVWLELLDREETFARFAMLTAFSGAYLNSLSPEALDELAAAFRPAGRARQLELVLRLDIRDLLPRIQAPTLVVGCTQDALIPVHLSREIHAAVPGSSYTELDSGHVARAERPEELAQLVRDFLA